MNPLRLVLRNIYHLSSKSKVPGQVRRFTILIIQARCVNDLFVLSVTNPDYTKLEEWRKYLQFEEQKNEPARVQVLYERVLQRYCLVPDLWLSYLAYLVQ